jgi:uncharacterized protein YprB with RNaseH-like and TPR domain
MPSLSDRLKSLGVRVGAGDLPQPQRANYPIERVVDGRTLEMSGGQTFLVEQRYPFEYQHGSSQLRLEASMEMMAEWAGDQRLIDLSPQDYVFVDTETTGLTGGSGTYAFMIGVGRFVEDGFQLTQFFMRDPAEEPAMLSALEQYLAGCNALVSFNGRSFDIPLIQARFITNGWPPQMADTAHLDLLFLARRLWRERLPSRALGYLEEHILGQTRTEEDTPGWMIPQMYFDYLRSGDARPMKGIFYHNAMDILSLVTLTEHMARMLEDPLGSQVQHALDLVALGRLHEDLGYWEKAVQIFTSGLEQDLPPEIHHQTVKRLSFLQRRRGELPEALSLWWQAATDHQIYAHEELAKYYEHQARDFQEAKRWTEAALAILAQPETPLYERLQWEDALQYRLARLERKLSRSSEGEE